MCCLLSNIPNHKELIENNFNSILFELNENELKIKFNRISLDSSLLNKLSKNALDKINKNNSLESSTNLFYQISANWYFFEDSFPIQITSKFFAR